MIRIDKAAWDAMVAHACATFPHECCGAMLGTADGDSKQVTVARSMTNVSKTPHDDSYELDPSELTQVDKEAGAAGLSVIGIYHSHPDADAYFSRRDLANSCPWYSFVVLSIKDGRFDHANSWLPDDEQTRAEKEELVYPGLS